MNQSEYDQLKSIAYSIDPTLSVFNVPGPDRTLIYGYDLDRSTVHVYLKNREIHSVLSDGAAGQRGSIMRYEHGEALPTNLLRPSKRAYPARTDYAAALRMAQLDCELPFTTFDAGQIELATDGFYGLVVDFSIEPYSKAI